MGPVSGCNGDRPLVSGRPLGWGEVAAAVRLGLSDFQLRVDADRAGEVVEIG